MINQMIKDSHRRCEEYGILPTQRFSSHILDLKDTTKRLENSSDLVLASGTIIKKL